MVLFSTRTLHLLSHVSIGLLSLLLCTECEKVRVINGPTRCAGRVEIFHNDRWGTVCDDNWSNENAKVVCRQLNCGTAIEAKRGAFYGQGSGDIWLDDVSCTGEETSIYKCPHRNLGDHNCGHGEDAGVVCSENVRVSDGISRCDGKVEVYHSGVWKSVCNTDWSTEEATVICNELSCGLPDMTVPLPQATLQGGLSTNCGGNETSIAQCSLQDTNATCTQAAVVCSSSKQVRLVNGSSQCSGRVEVFHEGQWGTICDDRWGMEDADVVCRQLKCGSALGVKHRAYFGRGQSRVWLDDVECNGQETSLSNCQHKRFGDHDCDHNEDAGVVCSDTTKLVNGSNRCSGRLEIIQGGHTFKMCRNGWGQTEARIACRELNCGDPSKTREVPNFGDNPGLRGYTSRCSGGEGSISQCNLQELTGDCESVSLSCSGSPPVRLVNGTDHCSGRVEILHDGTWGTVCDDEWDIRDAQVVCRIMDCGAAVSATTSAFFGRGDGRIWLDDTGCRGNETSLLQCRHPALGENNCGHGEDAGVVCVANIRLVNGTNQCSGRVEFYYGGQWVVAYNTNWDMNEATVVCREANCGDAVAASGSFGQSGEMRGYEVSCSGRENNLKQCRLREYVRRTTDGVTDGVVVCSGSVKLTGGHNKCVGRVELYDKGRWGPVCGETWDRNDARVVCRELNCGDVLKISSGNEFSQNAGLPWDHRVECNGMEMTLSDCAHALVGNRTCNSSAIASVTCSESMSVRLMGGPDECSGRVEVRQGDTWKTVCDNQWTLRKAAAVCDLMECGKAMRAPAGGAFGEGTGTVVEASDSCFADPSTIKSCSSTSFPGSTCGHDRDAGVYCAAQIRVVDGNECSGRVEILHKGQWGTVCDDEWGMRNAEVVCRQLNCGHAVSAPTNANFGRGNGPIWLDNVKCMGPEEAITHCEHQRYGENNCGHSEDAGVVCSGALKRPNMTVSPGSEISWGERIEITCSVSTENLRGTFLLKKTEGAFSMEQVAESNFVTFTILRADFHHSGSYFCEYKKKFSSQVVNYPEGNATLITVTVKLDQPSISLNSPDATVVYSPAKIAVSQGSTFSITCTTHSKYGNGVFNLRKGNSNDTQMKPVFPHTIAYMAVFDFSDVAQKHQGHYTCVYQVTVSQRLFSSTPSRALEVKVSGSSSSSVVAGIFSVILIIGLVVGGYFLWKKRGQQATATLSETMVHFINRFGGTVKPDGDERVNRVFDGRDDVSESSPRPAEKPEAAETTPDSVSAKSSSVNEPLVVL